MAFPSLNVGVFCGCHFIFSRFGQKHLLQSFFFTSLNPQLLDSDIDGISGNAAIFSSEGPLLLTEKLVHIGIFKLHELHLTLRAHK